MDESGIPHGTGTKRYIYPGGALKLEEYYYAGELQRSRWYSPDGALVAETAWQAGNGVAYFLRDDGSIEAVIEFRRGAANGNATYFRRDGSSERTATFLDGIEVAH